MQGQSAIVLRLCWRGTQYTSTPPHTLSHSLLPRALFDATQAMNLSSRSTGMGMRVDPLLLAARGRLSLLNSGYVAAIADALGLPLDRCIAMAASNSFMQVRWACLPPAPLGETAAEEEEEEEEGGGGGGCMPPVLLLHPCGSVLCKWRDGGVLLLMYELNVIACRLPRTRECSWQACPLRARSAEHMGLRMPGLMALGLVGG
jgi:hypothetical protein